MAPSLSIGTHHERRPTATSSADAVGGGERAHVADVVKVLGPVAADLVEERARREECQQRR